MGRPKEPSGPAPNGIGVRIVINAVAARMGGAATHLPNFLHTAGRRYPDDEFTTCVNAQWRFSGLPPNVRLVQTGALQNRLAHAAWDLWGVARLAARTQADVLVSLLNFGPVRSPVPHVLFQRNPTYFCEDYLRTLSRTGLIEVAATRALAHAVMRASRRIITPSAAMREMIRNYYPDLPFDKFCVIPHGFGRDRFEAHGALPPGVPEILDASEGPRLLYVSHAASYKGIEILLEAARRLRDDAFLCTVWLTIAKEDWPEGVPRFEAFIAQHNLGDRVKLLGRIPHEAVHQLYRAADVFVYPSLCESFGFPQVEAMASGLPIIAADRPLNKEMCGDAAVYYPAHDAAALAREIVSLAGDEARRRGLVAAGQARAQRFSWDAHVDAVMAVVRQVAGERPQASAAGRASGSGG